MQTVEQILKHVADMRTRKQVCEESLRAARKKKLEAESDLAHAENARQIIQVVAQMTQENLEYHVSEIVTLALNSIFPEDNYQMKLRFVLRRGRTEAEILLCSGDKECDPMDSNGGGVVDIMAFALRLSLWSLQNPKSRAIIVLDEPMRFLSARKDLQKKAGELLKELSDRLGIQFIVVTHEDELVSAADRVFEVTKKDGESLVTVSV